MNAEHDTPGTPFLEATESYAQGLFAWESASERNSCSERIVDFREGKAQVRHKSAVCVF
jgi:hypothetical protein